MVANQRKKKDLKKNNKNDKTQPFLKIIIHATLIRTIFFYLQLVKMSKLK